MKSHFLVFALLVAVVVGQDWSKILDKISFVFQDFIFKHGFILASCSFTQTNRNDCFQKLIFSFVANTNSESSIFNNVNLMLPPTSFIPIDGLVQLKNVRILGFNNMRFRHFSVNSINFARNSEFEFTMILHLPRQIIMANFSHPEFNGQFQIVNTDYTITLNLFGNLQDNTESGNFFQYINFTRVRMGQNLREFKMVLSNTDSKEHGDLKIIVLI
jgi:hypothetical protein